MYHADIAHRLSQPCRDLLIEHVDGGCWNDVPVTTRIKYRVHTMTALMDAGLIRYAGAEARSARPTATRITEDGRMVLSLILASYAESLIRAGCGIEMEATNAVSQAARRVFHRIAVEDRRSALPV